jgi:signal peptidase I
MDPGPRPPPRIVFPRISRRTLGLILAPAALVLLLHAFVLGTLHVVGASMEATLEPGDLVLVSKLCYRPERGDLVAFHLPQKPSLLLVKRVVGLPGDRVVIARGVLRVTDVDGVERPDPARGGGSQARADQTTGSVDIVVARDALFVLGDNRAAGASSDSRDWGSVASDEVVGHVVLLLHPLARAGWL